MHETPILSKCIYTLTRVPRRHKGYVHWTPGEKRLPVPDSSLNPVDLSGREIYHTVLSVANRIAPKAIPYAEILLGDPAVAANLFEQAAASVSEAIKTKQANGSAVRDLAAYLFRAYIRLVSESRRKDATLQASFDAQAESQVSHSDLVRAEAALLLDEIMRTCDRLLAKLLFVGLRASPGKRSVSGMDSPVTRLRRDLAKLLTAREKG